MGNTVDYVGDLQEVSIVFQGNEENPDLVFVEVETPHGYSINVGTWETDGDGFHRLKIRVPVTDMDEASRARLNRHG